MSTTILKRRCPKCRSKNLSVQVITWANFEEDPTDPDGHSRPSGFDEGDLESVQPLPNGESVCRTCGHFWTAREAA